MAQCSGYGAWIDSSSANCMGYQYDWKVTNSKKTTFLRSIYLVYKE